jgi:hypothetical protein
VNRFVIDMILDKRSSVTQDAQKDPLSVAGQR